MHGFTTNFHLFDYLVLVLMILCIWTDLKSRKIYNLVLIPFLLIGLGVNILSANWHGLSQNIWGLLLGLVLLLIPFAKGGIGGGDVKLLAVIGGIKGPSFVLMVFLYGAIAGGIFALVLLLWHRRLLTTLSAGWTALSNALVRKGIFLPGNSNEESHLEPIHLPYSLPLGAGVLITYTIMLKAGGVIL